MNVVRYVLIHLSKIWKWGTLLNVTTYFIKIVLTNGLLEMLSAQTAKQIRYMRRKGETVDNNKITQYKYEKLY